VDGKRIRYGYRVGKLLAIDIELIVGGFSGVEGVGWENLGGYDE